LEGAGDGAGRGALGFAGRAAAADFFRVAAPRAGRFAVAFLAADRFAAPPRRADLRAADLLDGAARVLLLAAFFGRLDFLLAEVGRFFFDFLVAICDAPLENLLIV